MRLTLIDLLLFEALATFGAVIGCGLARLINLPHHPHHFSFLFGVLGMGGAVLMLSGPIYQRFHFRPLWLPPCPHCHKIPDAYHVVDGVWPWYVIACAQCGERVEVWMCRRVDPAAASVQIVSYCLRWPEAIGWWRYVRPVPSETSSADPRAV